MTAFAEWAKQRGVTLTRTQEQAADELLEVIYCYPAFAGPASGKTFLLQLLEDYLKERVA